MIITAKFAGRCACCSQPIAVGSKIEWSKGAPAQHEACAGTVTTVASRVRAPRRASYARGRWNGCACGAREMPDGTLSANACARCRFDAE